MQFFASAPEPGNKAPLAVAVGKGRHGRRVDERMYTETMGSVQVF